MVQFANDRVFLSLSVRELIRKWQEADQSQSSFGFAAACATAVVSAASAIRTKWASA
jgi:hypothetical protein